MDNSGDNNTVTDTNFDGTKLVDESPVTISIDEESPATEPAPVASTEPVAEPAPETPAEPTAETPAPEPTPEPTPSEPETITPAPISPNSISSNANTQGQKDNKQLYSIILFAVAGFLIVFALIGLIASIAKLALIICFVLAVACGVVAYKFNNDTKNTKKTSAEMSFKPTAADDKNIAPDFAAIAAKPEPTNTYVAVSPFTVIKYPNGRDAAEEEPAEEASDVTLPDEKKDEEPKTQSLTGPEAYKALTPDMISGIEFGLGAISAATPDNLKNLISSIDFKLTEAGNLESSIKSVALSESDKQSVLDFLKDQLKATTENPDYSFDKAYGVDLDLKLYNDINWSINYK